MRLSLTFGVLAVCTASAVADTLTVTRNANHIFNAVHNAMRQWGSSIQHNGMTAFVATVPADIELYHGTGYAQRINGTQWLAFEPEHALLFASSLHGAPPSSKPKKPPGDGKPPPRKPSQERLLHHDPHAQVMLGSMKLKDGEPAIVTHGYLHTYRTKHALRLLYVDGQSAAKSKMGTLDLQDVVILEGTLNDDDPDFHDGPLNEHARAIGLCERAQEQWQGKIDGILRMEAGFEIILCSFEKHLDAVSIKRSKDREVGPHELEAEKRHPKGSQQNMLNYYKMVATRNHGIGGGRVQLDSNNGILSLYAYPGAVTIDSAGRPRADSTAASMKDFRKHLDQMLSSTSDDMIGTDWQATSDMIVARYADRLEAMSQATKLADLQAHLEVTYAPFVDYGNRSDEEEVARCAAKDLPRGTMDSFGESTTSTISPAGISVAEVSHRICSDLHEISQMDSLKAMLTRIDALRQWLAWPTWKYCRGCTAEEVCFTPIWPAGSVEDFEKPKCKSYVGWDEHADSYWRD